MSIRLLFVWNLGMHTLGRPLCRYMLGLDTLEVSKEVSINTYTVSIANHHT